MQDSAAYLLAQKSVILVAWFACLFAAERCFPAVIARLDEAGWRRVARNVALWAANTALSPLIVVPVTVWAAAHALFARPEWWSGAGALILDLAVLDALTYWWHRANHRIPFLWRFHSIHHLDRTLDTTTAVRFHFAEILLSAAARALVVMLLAVPVAAILLFETVLLAATIFHHSNVRLPPRLEQALRRAVVTPSIHWVHHHRRQSDTDANYATVLSLWDPVFRSRSPTARTADMEIGVEGRDEQRLVTLFVAPFKASRRDADRSSRTNWD